MKTVYLFRHGEVEDHYRNRVRGGATDCLLSAAGERMSIANAQFIVREKIELIVTSGMKRTDYVGEYTASEHKIPHLPDNRLREMDMREWEGKLLDDVNAAHPDAAKLFAGDPLCGAFPGLENPADYRQRVLGAWNDILSRDEERIAIIAHGITNAVILRSILDDMPYGLKQKIGCMNEIVIDPPPRLIRENVLLYEPKGA